MFVSDQQQEAASTSLHKQKKVEKGFNILFLLVYRRVLDEKQRPDGNQGMSKIHYLSFKGYL